MTASVAGRVLVHALPSPVRRAASVLVALGAGPPPEAATYAAYLSLLEDTAPIRGRSAPAQRVVLKD